MSGFVIHDKGCAMRGSPDAHGECTCSARVVLERREIEKELKALEALVDYHIEFSKTKVKRIEELEAELRRSVPWDEHKKAIELAYFEGALRCGWEQSRALERLTERDAASQAETSAEGKS